MTTIVVRVPGPLDGLGVASYGPARREGANRVRVDVEQTGPIGILPFEPLLSRCAEVGLRQTPDQWVARVDIVPTATLGGGAQDYQGTLQVLGPSLRPSPMVKPIVNAAQAAFPVYGGGGLLLWADPSASAPWSIYLSLVDLQSAQARVLAACCRGYPDPLILAVFAPPTPGPAPIPPGPIPPPAPVPVIPEVP